MLSAGMEPRHGIGPMHVECWHGTKTWHRINAYCNAGMGPSHGIGSMHIVVLAWNQDMA